MMNDDIDLGLRSDKSYKFELGTRLQKMFAPSH